MSTLKINLLKIIFNSLFGCFLTSMEEKVSELENVLMRTLYIQQGTELGLKSFQTEMKEFKDEMNDFKNEMKEFKIEMNKRWGDLANKMGTVIEDIVAPNIPRIAQEFFNCESIDRFLIRPYVTHSLDIKRRREFDVVVKCANFVFLTETKSKVTQVEIDNFLSFIDSGDFFNFFPEFSGNTLVPFLASTFISENLVNYMTKKKIVAVSLADSTMNPVNIEVVSKFYQS